MRFKVRDQENNTEYLTQTTMEIPVPTGVIRVNLDNRFRFESSREYSRMMPDRHELHLSSLSFFVKPTNIKREPVMVGGKRLMVEVDGVTYWLNTTTYGLSIERGDWKKIKFTSVSDTTTLIEH